MGHGILLRSLGWVTKISGKCYFPLRPTLAVTLLPVPKAVFQWCVFLRTRLRTYAQYGSMNEFTCSEHSVRIPTVRQKNGALEVNPYTLPNYVIYLFVFCYVRLVFRFAGNDSDIIRAGRLEILYERQWLSYCGEGWDALKAHVACKTLRFGTYTKFKINASSPVQMSWLKGLNCAKHDKNLQSCSYKEVQSGVCNKTVWLDCKVQGKWTFENIEQQYNNVKHPETVSLLCLYFKLYV